jgi:ribosomal protein L11 methyltransferase
VSAWIQVSAVFSQAPADWSVYIDAFDRFGCPGSQIEDAPPRVTGYLTEVTGAEAQADRLEAELRQLGADDVQRTVVQDQDWTELWKVHFKPRRIGPRLVIRPTWEDFGAGPDDVVIVLDPGQAFGTGDHPTTRLCLELLEQLDLTGKSVADIGCGSGILAIAAAKLGAVSVVASDLDPLAVEVTRENMARNDVDFHVDTAEGFAILGEPADVVVSNIISATLIRLAPDAAKVVAPGGWWLVSGIYQTNWPDVRAAAERAGFRFESEQREDDWVAASFRR